MRRRIRIPLRVEWTLTCPVCGRKRQVTVTPGTRRTIRCGCGRYEWKL